MMRATFRNILKGKRPYFINFSIGVRNSFSLVVMLPFEKHGSQFLFEVVLGADILVHARFSMYVTMQQN